MTTQAPNLHEVSDREFVVDHTIHAPPQRVFEAYTKRDQIVKWWAQPGKTMRIDEMEVRSGGKWRFVHVGADGQEMMMHGKYELVNPVTRLSYTYNLGEGNDNEILATVDLRPVEGGTHLTLTNRAKTKAQLDMMLQYGARGGAKMALLALDAFLRRE